jgi:NTF2 fold immunity protein
MKAHLLACSAFLLVPSALSQGFKPQSGFVPDSSTAVKIAEAVLAPVYGEKKIAAERPFTATLKDGTWIVEGALHCPGAAAESNVICMGGVAVVHISKADGRILLMSHGK